MSNSNRNGDNTVISRADCFRNERVPETPTSQYLSSRVTKPVRRVFGGNEEKRRSQWPELTVVVPLLEILRQSRYFLAGQEVVPLDWRQGVGQGLGRGQVPGRAGQVEGRVAAEVPQRRVRTCQDQPAHYPRLPRQHGQVQRGLAVVVQYVQQAGMRRHADQAERSLQEPLDDRDVQLPGKGKREVKLGRSEPSSARTPGTR